MSGGLEVFYTQSFHNTLPIVFQFTHIYPFLINPFLTILFPISITSILFIFKGTLDKKIILIIVAFLILFIPQTFLFSKWTRYMLPTLPFIYIIIGVFLSSFFDLKNKLRAGMYSLGSVLIAVSAIYSISYLKVIEESTVIMASEWALKNIRNDSKIISEVYDLGIIPFNRYFRNVTLFDFYALDNKNTSDLKKDELNELIADSDYLIIPSQRIMRNRIINKNEFPNGYRFYKDLDEKFELVYKTPCDIFCKILYLGDPIFAVEETANVFDRPTIQIYKINHVE